MNILLINVPSRRGAGGIALPLGLLYAASSAEREGHKAKIVDPYMEDVELKKFDAGDHGVIDTAITDFKPDIIGYGGVATSYGRAKKLSMYIRKRHPAILQIAGGPLASTYELIHANTPIDAVFHGEAEVSLADFLGRLSSGRDYRETNGISYLKDGQVIRNPDAEQIKDIDQIPFPAYHLIDIKRYLERTSAIAGPYRMLIKTNPKFSYLKDHIGSARYHLPIVTARGCTHRCSFCYRHLKGVRQHSVKYVIEHIKLLKSSYGADDFTFCDELFNSRLEWVYELCDSIEREGLDIFYRVAGARVDKIDEKMLKRLKETGCIQIEYGQESGSDTILKEYRKGVSAKQNLDGTALTTKVVGILSAVQLVVGSPSESSKTIRETIAFMKDLDAYDYSLNYLMPLPGAPIWEYVKEHNIIDDVEGYLDRVAEYGGRPLVNLTRQPDRVWRGWAFLVRKEIRLHYYKKYDRRNYLKFFLLYNIVGLVIDFIPLSIRRTLGRIVNI